MTLVDANAAMTAAPHRNRGRLWLSGVSLAMAAVGIAVSIWTLTYVFTYQTLQRGPVGAPVVGQAKALTDGIEDPTEIILTGPPHSVGGQMESIENDGSRSVRILGEASNSFFRTAWLPGYPSANASFTTDVLTANRFPMTLRPHRLIQVFITVTKPASCKGSAGIAFSGSVDLRTEVLGVHHEYSIPITNGFGQGLVPFVPCPTKAAFKHVAND